MSDLHWKQGQLVEVTIADLSPTGDGVARWGSPQRVVFVPNTVPGDRLTARLVRVKPSYAHGQLQELIAPSDHRVRPPCIVADKCGGCQWQPVEYAFQLQAKRQQITQVLERIGKLDHPPVEPVLPALSPLAYRNKVTYPLRGKHNADQVAVQAGYYRKGSHRLVNLNQCPVQDPAFNPLLAEVKQDIQRQGWPIYDEQTHRGQVRHLALRVGRRTGELLMTLVVCDRNLPHLAEQAQVWMERYPQLVGVCLNFNAHRTNRIFGPQTECIIGQPYIHEEFAGLRFQIRADTFFQVYTEQAEALLEMVMGQLAFQGHELVLDAYCGIGTLTLPIARRVRQVVGLERQPAAVELARTNAALNGIGNVTFEVGAVESQLATLELQPDVVLLDPPRKGCTEGVIEHLLELQPAQIVYVSCHPATLARDLQRLGHSHLYQLHRVQPVDFFPQTAHVECVAFLRRIPTS